MSENVPSKRTGKPRTAVVALMSVAGGLGGLLGMPEPPVHAAGAVELRLAEHRLAPEAGPSAARAFIQSYLSAPITLHAQGSTLTLRRGDLGARIDEARLAALLGAAADPTSAMRRAHERLLRGEPLALPLPAALDAVAATPWLLQLKDQLDRPASDAHVDPRRKLAVPGVPGAVLDVQGSLDRLERAIVLGERSVELATLALPPREAQLSVAGLAMDAVLGEMSTRYNRGPEARDRTANLRVAASKIDGRVVRPGEVFDFNAVVGDRTAWNGFKRAPVIADGELVDGVGGGTCQIASTLHAAVFFAGLPVLTRTPHSHPSYYVKLGLDAAVAYGSLNFRFQNDLPFPLVIEATVDDGFVRVALHGKERTRTVTFLRRVDATTPFEERFEHDPALPSGVRLLQQRGVPGFAITTFRVVRDERSGVARRERGQDSYPPTHQLWRIGSGPAAPAGFVPPRNDGHPEYLADEVMSATQGPGTKGIEVSATAGKTGTPGWIVREGLIKPGSSS